MGASDLAPTPTVQIPESRSQQRSAVKLLQELCRSTLARVWTCSDDLIGCFVRNLGEYPRFSQFLE